MNEYKQYQAHLSYVPLFLYKYLKLDIIKRLKNVSLFCGMDYASPHMYSFKYPISRYDHSLNVALLTWNLTQDKTKTIAALFHDVSTPVFSHVIDYMNKDYINQESTEDKTREVLLSCKQLLRCLKRDNIDIEDVSNFKQYSIVDSPRPALCADRIENIIGVGMSWVQKVDLNTAIKIVDSLAIYQNEDGLEELGVNSYSTASIISGINSDINTYTHSDEDKYMMLLLADIVKTCINYGLVEYDDLYKLNERQIVKIINNNLSISELKDMWEHFRTVERIEHKPYVETKKLTLNPLVCGRRYK